MTHSESTDAIMAFPPRRGHPEEGRHCFHPDQNDRRDFISAFLQVSGGEWRESSLRVYKALAD